MGYDSSPHFTLTSLLPSPHLWFLLDTQGSHPLGLCTYCSFYLEPLLPMIHSHLAQYCSPFGSQFRHHLLSEALVTNPSHSLPKLGKSGWAPPSIGILGKWDWIPGWFLLGWFFPSADIRKGYWRALDVWSSEWTCSTAASSTPNTRQGDPFTVTLLETDWQYRLDTMEEKNTRNRV